MPDTLAEQTSSPAVAASTTVNPPGLCRRAIDWIPVKARLAVLSGSLVLVGIAAYSAFSSGSATLHMSVRHNFREAEISVLVDGRPSLNEHLSGASKKRLGLFEQIEGNFSKSVAIPSGDHTVEVELRSTADGVNLARSSHVKVESGQEATISVSANRNNMTLNYQGAAVVQDSSNAHLTENAMSLLLTMLGSVGSAAVGFFVQEFLRSKKPA